MRALALIFAVALSSNSMIGNRTAFEEFENPKLAALADDACKGDVPKVVRSLQEGVDPNGKGKEGDTPLFWAVKCEQLAAIEILLNHGADPNYRIPGHFSATFAASTMDNSALLEMLLKHGGDPNGSSIGGRMIASNALDLGVTGHGWKNFELLLDAGLNINFADNAGNTIATRAVALGAFDQVEELLRRGYDYDYVGLARAVTTRNSNEPSRERIIAFLKQKGVMFPVPPLVEIYSGRARMESDGTLIVDWYGGYPTDGSPRIEAHIDTFKPDNAGYDDMLVRIGGLKPGYGKGVPRRPEDPPFFPPKRNRATGYQLQFF